MDPLTFCIGIGLLGLYAAAYFVWEWLGKPAPGNVAGPLANLRWRKAMRRLIDDDLHTPER